MTPYSCSRWFVALLVALAGCERPPDEPVRAAETRPFGGRIEDGERAQPGWATAARELAVEAEDEESFDACVERVSGALPVELAEGLFDIGYTAAAEDACVAKDALKRRDAARCDALTMDGAQTSCRRRIAVLSGDAEACRLEATPLGRDATCLAWTTRDAAICGAAPHAERALCEAVIRRDASVCERERGPARTRCELELRRMGPSVAERPAAAGRPSPYASFVLVEADGTEHALGGVDLSAGVVVLRCGDRGRLLLRNASRLSTQALASALDLPVGALVVDTSGVGRIAFSDARAGFVAAYPNGENLGSDASTRGFVRLRTFTRERGAQVVGDFELSLRHGLANERVTARGNFQTFVRDVVDGDDACTAPPTSFR